jgi:hypothetical protein
MRGVKPAAFDQAAGQGERHLRIVGEPFRATATRADYAFNSVVVAKDLVPGLELEVRAQGVATRRP